HWAWEAVRGLAVRGALDGYPDGSFRPGAAISRAEFVKALALALRWQLPAVAQTNFRDVGRGDWFASYVAVAAGAGLVTGDAGLFRPQDPIQRQEVAAVVARYLHLGEGAAPSVRDLPRVAPWARAAVAGVLDSGIMTGYPDGTFRPEASITRAEAAAVLMRVLQRQRMW
ncbi:MAG: S-layer homology domain-containing protein, partial [Clostridia bacterium]|nr:S-layer homology domain-containing protein [Clostridia bacterium]